jgi:hypothetical protein
MVNSASGCPNSSFYKWGLLLTHFPLGSSTISIVLYPSIYIIIDPRNEITLNYKLYNYSFLSIAYFFMSLEIDLV